MIVEVNDLLLNVEGSGDGPPVVLLHGFTGSSRSLLSFARSWPGFSTLALDVIGHGMSDSPEDASRYTMDRCIDDIEALVEVLDLGKIALLGYSMGGRIAVRYALRHPERLWALVLESASTGIEDEAERQARIQSDEALAQRLERKGLEPFIDYWQSIPLWASQASLPQEKRDALRAQRMQNSVTGLANSLRGMGAGADPAVFDKLSTLEVPSLIMAGGLDTKYRDLAIAMGATMPDATVRILDNAGHAAHFEQPAAFANAVFEFLQIHAPAGAPS
ncbi:MAG: 2-succinyl-6-hydroxy-2,4-cyclohexadiene-1-carboxylate synthase [Dehalococcoidia bacterium]